MLQKLILIKDLDWPFRFHCQKEVAFHTLLRRSGRNEKGKGRMFPNSGV